MNGRCQKDALDRAEDICELCGHQYCAQCLLFPRGHRNAPTCKTCALENSGIRGGSNKHHVISKREYKKRKKELLAQLEDVEEQQPAIEFFELNDPSQFDQSTELDRRPAAIEEEPTIDILAASDDPPPPSPPAPHAAPPAPPTPPAPAVEPAPADHAASGLAPVDTSVNPLALGGAPPSPAVAQPAAASEGSEASSSAADLLARLKADQPIQSQFNAAPVGLDTDPFASPTPDLAAPQTHVPTPASLTPPASVAPPAPLTPTSAVQTAAPAPLAPEPMNPAPLRPTPMNSAPLSPAPMNSSPAPGRPKSEPWSPPTPPPRGSNLDSIGNEETISPVPAAPTAAQPAPLAAAPTAAQPAPLAAAPMAAQPAPFAAVPVEAAPPLEASPFGDDTPRAEVAGDATHMRRKADTDESGQWIPPSLRGMATPDERDPLPKRRS